MDLQVKVVSGGFWRGLTTVIAYESSIPLTYIAKWNRQLPNEETYTTTNSARECISDDVTFCKLWSHNEDLAREEMKLLEAMENSMDPKFYLDAKPEDFTVDETRQTVEGTRRKRNLSGALGSVFSWCCSLVTESKANELIVQQDKFKEQLEKFRKGLTTEFRSWALTTKEFENYDNKLHNTFETIVDKIKAIERFDSQILNETRSGATVLKDVYMLGRANFEQTQREARLLRLLRHNEIISACKDRHIPAALIPPRVLQVDLLNLRRKLYAYGLDIAIPTSAISQYYRLPITDCVSSADEIAVHVKIPVVQAKKNWSLLELVTTPFAWHNSTCVIQHDALYLAVSGTSLRTVSREGIKDCRPHTDKLCYLPRFSSDAVYGPGCAFRLYQGSTVDELAKHCSFRCYPATTLTISEVADDTYIITHPKEGMTVKCKDQSDQKLESIYNKPGSIQVKLPCHCALWLKEDQLIPPRYPCAEGGVSQTELVHLLPAVWSTLKSFRVNPLRDESLPVFNNLSECLNSNWALEIPHLNISKINHADVRETVSKFLDEIPTYGRELAHHSDTVLYIWDFLITIVLLRMVLVNRRIIFTGMIPPAVHAQAAGGIGPVSKGLVIIFLTLAILICTLITLCLCYIAFMALKQYWERMKNKRNASEHVPLEVLEELTEGLLTTTRGSVIATVNLHPSKNTCSEATVSRPVPAIRSSPRNFRERVQVSEDGDVNIFMQQDMMDRSKDWK